MPPWPSRLVSTSHPPSANTDTSNSRQTAQSYQPLDHEFESIPTLRPQISARPSKHVDISNRNGSGHGRSLSHPFPSIFGASKKADERAGEDDIEDEFGIGQKIMEKAPIETSPKWSKPQTPQRLADKDMTTGRCMTCDSTVRWPRSLTTFRCTICLTINDLTVAKLNPQGLNRQLDAEGKPRAKGGIDQINVSPISVPKTKALIDRSLRIYLMGRQKTIKTIRNGEKVFTGASERQQDSLDLPTSLNMAPDIPPIYLSSPSFDADGYEPDWRFPNHALRTDQGPNSSSSNHLPFPTTNRHRSSSETSVPQVPNRPPPVPPKDDINLYHNSLPNRNLQDTHGRKDLDPLTAVERGPKLDQGHGISKPIFRSLDDYIVSSFASYECLNSSFSTVKNPPATIPKFKPPQSSAPFKSKDKSPDQNHPPLFNLDEKTLLLGDFAENGSWWTGGREKLKAIQINKNTRERSPEKYDPLSDIVSVKTPRIDWIEVGEFYQTILRVEKDWKLVWQEINSKDSSSYDGELSALYDAEEIKIGQEIREACLRTQRTLLKATEALLKRPGRPFRHPFEIRFLLIIMSNPLLHQNASLQPHSEQLEGDAFSRGQIKLNVPGGPRAESHRTRSGPGQHSGIIKRILGIMSNLPNDCHHHLVSWFSRLSESHFRRMVELVGGFVTYRLNQQHGRKRSDGIDPTAGLVPTIDTPGGGSSATLHAALGVAGSSKTPATSDNGPTIYSEDWRIKAAAKVMALLFSANSNATVHRTERERQQLAERAPLSAGRAAQLRAHSHGQMLPTSDFYNSLLDYSDLLADFEAWEKRRGKFAFCQYPFFLSLWAKIHILEYDARRQMEVRAREAFFESIMTRKAIPQYLVLRVRRDCLVEDSLQGVSEVVGAGQEEIKKGLRIDFVGEEGIDAGGLRKEWFLLLVRDIFDPHHGLFVYDDDSHCCYFNPHCFETSDQFFLVGVLLGLAIHNSTILDIALPPFAFRKLLASAPTPSSKVPKSSTARINSTFTVDDLAEFRPSLAHGLKQLLEFEGDVEETFCRDFVIEFDKFSSTIPIPLCPGGHKRPVTNANRQEFVDLYVHYLLDTAVARQFEPFKRGFFTVCGGNALSLFRPEEIELLIRGSDEPLDVSSLRAVAVYENWNSKSPADTELVVQWFWEFFERINPKEQRQILSFITGSDRIPAMGATNLVIKIACLGDDCERFPVARTCFNALQLWRYRSRQKLEARLWRAVVESEGFGLR